MAEAAWLLFGWLRNMELLQSERPFPKVVVSPTSSAALLLTRSVVVMATAALCAPSAVGSRVLASSGTPSSSAAILSWRPMTPVDSMSTWSAGIPSAVATASALARQFCAE